jgi:hypothetical protein
MPNKPTAKLPPYTLQEYAAKTCLPLEWLQSSWHLAKGWELAPHVAIPYQREGADELIRRRYGKDDKGHKILQWKKGAAGRLFLYGQKQLLKPQPPGENWIIVVEGESDTQTLTFNGYPVLGVPGCSTWNACIKSDPDVLKLFEHKIVLFIQEPPAPNGVDASATLAQDIANTLPANTVIAVKLWQITGDKDANDLWVRLLEEHGGDWNADSARTAFRTTLFAAFDTACRDAAFVRPVGSPERKQIEAVAEQFKMVTFTYDTVEAEAWEWLWEDRLPLGCITLWYGGAGTGKSTCAIDIVARGSKGLPMPDRAASLPLFDSLILATEDSDKKTIKPRLMAAMNEGADYKHVHGLKQSKLTGTSTMKERRFALSSDVAVLEQWLKDHPDVRLVVIDPISSYIGESKKQNDSSDVRPMLEAVQEMAERMKVAIIGVMHVNKNAEQAVLHRISGSSAWGEVVRSAWVFVEERDQTGKSLPDRYLMLNSKANFVGALNRNGVAYQTFGKIFERPGESPIKTSFVTWGAPAEVTAEEAMASPSAPRGMQPVKKEAAKAWLLAYLAKDDGSMKASGAMQTDAKAAGYSYETYVDARDELKDACKIRPCGKIDGRFHWQLVFDEPASPGDVETDMG